MQHDTRIRRKSDPSRYLDGLIRCPDCREYKPESEYGRKSSRRDGIALYCRVCMSVRNKINHCKNGKPSKRSYERHKLGREGYDNLLSAQGGGCYICERVPDGEELLVIDHDHDCCAGRLSCGDCIRGLLCHNCNVGLGHFQNDLDLFRRAIEYLTKNKTI